MKLLIKFLFQVSAENSELKDQFFVSNIYKKNNRIEVINKNILILYFLLRKLFNILIDI